MYTDNQINKMRLDVYEAARNGEISDNLKDYLLLTIESSGIAIACAVARILKVPAVFCKKSKSSNVPEDVYSVTIHSFTHNKDFNVIVSKQFVSKDDSIPSNYFDKLEETFSVYPGIKSRLDSAFLGLR